MAREKQKVYEKIQEDFQKDTIAGSKLRKDVPLLATNLNNPKHIDFIFNEYRKEGLIPKKFKTAEQLRNYLHRRLFAEMSGIIKSDPSIKGDKGFKEAYFKKRKKEILEKLVQDEAISKLKPSQRTPEQLKQISKMRWTGLPIKVNHKGELKFHRRYFQDKVSKRVIEYANSIEAGLGDKWAKEMRASWNAIGERNKAIKAASGLSFDIGHFIPSALDGPNVGINAAPEPSAANRSKGSTPFSADRNLARQLGIPESWMQSFTDWHLRQKGMDPNLLPKGYELKGSQVVDAASGISDPNLEIAKNRTRFELDQQEIPEGKLQTDFEVVDGQVVKKPKQAVIQQILGVKKKTNKLSGISDLLANTPENYEVNYTPKPNNVNVNPPTVKGTNVETASFIKGLKKVNPLSGLSKLRDADQLTNIGVNLSTGNYVGAGIGVATYGTSKALQDPRVQSRVSKQIMKLVADRGKKSAAKLIPGLDILLSGKESWDYLKRGRWDQAGVAALSGAIGWIPVIGDGASAALDLSNTGLDIARLQAPTGAAKKKGKNRLQRYLKSFYN